MTVQHFTLTPDGIPGLYSTYCSTLVRDADEGPIDHPGSFSARAEGQSVRVTLYHGRTDPDASMDDWGFDGPTFECLSVAHDPDRVLLQHASPDALALAQTLGLAVHHDTITVDYFDDMLYVPNFEEKPSYFGDFSITLSKE